ncbi:MAG: hypothetical protein ACR2IT_04850 [Pirellulales bacterium]
MDPTNDYQPVSPLAVAALVGGVCSALALATRFAWVVPIVGAALALAALADIGRPGAVKAGRLLALAGLALSLGFGAQAVTTAIVDRWIVSHRAVTAAATWIDAVRTGRPAEALGVSASSLLPAHAVPGEDPPESPADRMARFTAMPPVQAVAACGETRPRVASAAPLGSDDGAWTVRATLAGCGAAGAGSTLRLVVVPKGVKSGKGRLERWVIAAVDVER